jgi:hypothetical protein
MAKERAEQTPNRNALISLAANKRGRDRARALTNKRELSYLGGKL